MSSPQIVTFFVFNPNTGAPVTGLAGSMVWTTHKDETGATVTPPTIVEIGGGAYYFTPTFASPSHGIAYVVTIGSSHEPPFISGYLRPEDYAGDLISDLHAVAVGKWSINTSTNVLTLYKEDGVTILKQF